MREIEMWEIWHDKCPVCGAHNKIHTQLVDPRTDKYVGYTLKCCMCGYYRTFFNEHESNGKQGVPDYTYSTQRCLQPSYCPHKDCALYGTCVHKRIKNKKPSIPNHKGNCGCKNKPDIDMLNTTVESVDDKPRFL